MGRRRTLAQALAWCTTAEKTTAHPRLLGTGSPNKLQRRRPKLTSSPSVPSCSSGARRASPAVGTVTNNLGGQAGHLSLVAVAVSASG